METSFIIAFFSDCTNAVCVKINLTSDELRYFNAYFETIRLDDVNATTPFEKQVISYIDDPEQLLLKLDP